MSILENKKSILVGHIKTIGTKQLLGSCVPFKYKNELFIITCGHVIYKKDWSDLLHDIIDLEVEINSYKYKLSKILGTKDNTKDTDLSIIKLAVSDLVNESLLVEFELFEVKDDKYLSYSKICIYPELDERVQAIGNIRYAGKKSELIFSVEVDKDRFYNINQGASGASQYKGISGSGLFCEHNGKLFLQGIVKSIPNVTVNTEVDLVSVKAISTILDDVIISNCFEKNYPQFHHNSLLNSDASREVLTRQLINHLSDKKYKVLVCAPSDNSSSNRAKNVYSKLIKKLDEEKINYSVGGGKDHLIAQGSYPHIEEIDFISSNECSTLIIIADDHSTFSQLSLLSRTIFYDHNNKTEVYIFYEDSVISSQSFIKNGPFKFAAERIRARVYEFSKFNDSMISDVVGGIHSHHICLGKIA
ncbi:TPA: hypothetical protein RQL16_004361 [Vibrio vulnificus]|nr:hypothetical protein [Vibrio vulnificus]HDY8220463.1 hypothetical protein [Vibrio vulnificus]